MNKKVMHKLERCHFLIRDGNNFSMVSDSFVFIVFIVKGKKLGEVSET